MARLPRVCPPDIPQHIIQRGNNRQPCFASEQDMQCYIHLLDEYARECGVAVHAWVLMTNHVHLLATPAEEGGISRMMQALGRRYVRYFNREYSRTGTLWEGRFKSCLIDSEHYMLRCQRYIELNPVRAKMVEAPQDYFWSSYQCHGMSREASLHTPHDEYLRLGDTNESRLSAYRELFRGHVDDDFLNEIRVNTQKGMALGSDQFKQQVEQLCGRRMRPAKIGRPPRREKV